MDVARQVAYWKDGSEEDWASAGRLEKLGSDLHWALFVMHLAVEKALKAKVTAVTESVPPKTHNLLQLAERAGMKLGEEQLILLQEANQFCMSTRYPEEVHAMRERVNADMCREYRERLGAFRKWVLEQI